MQRSAAMVFKNKNNSIINVMRIHEWWEIIVQQQQHWLHRLYHLWWYHHHHYYHHNLILCTTRLQWRRHQYQLATIRFGNTSSNILLIPTTTTTITVLKSLNVQLNYILFINLNKRLLCLERNNNDDEVVAVKLEANNLSTNLRRLPLEERRTADSEMTSTVVVHNNNNSLSQKQCSLSNDETVKQQYK